MKIRLTQKQVEEHTAASRRGAIEGTILGGSIAFAGSYWAQRRLPAYRNLPLSLKALGIIIITAPLLSIQAERRGLEYDRSQWEGAARELMDEKEFEEETRWQKLSLWDKVGDWSYRHQYSLIMGSWATSLAVAGTIISRNEYQTYPQKIVQARMWAQGLTIGLLIVAGALTHSRKRLENEAGDHSWRDIIDQQERERRRQAAYAARMKEPAGAPA